MSKSETKTAKLDIAIPATGFSKCLYFNTFRVEKEEGFRLLQVGLVTSFGVVDTYACVVTDFALEQNKESVLGYLAKLGPAEEAAPHPWKGAPIQANADVVDILHMSYRGKMAELTFFTFSLTSATKLGKAATVASPELIPSQALALLRCSPDLQRHLIAGLYE